MKNRQLELIIYLLKHKKSTYKTLAEHFEVSRKTVERDIDRLSAIGIPVHCNQGSSGGVFLDESYKFSQSFFTPADIAHMVTALHITKAFTSNNQNNEILQKLSLIDPSLTELFKENVSKHFFLDIYSPAVDFYSDIYVDINKCMDLKVYGIINDVFEVVPLSYVFKSDGVHLFCYKDDYKLLKVAEIQSFVASENDFSGEFITYDEWENKITKLF